MFLQGYFTFSSRDLRYISISLIRKSLTLENRKKETSLQLDQVIVTYFTNMQTPQTNE